MEAFVNYFIMLSVIVAVIIAFAHLVYKLSNNRYSAKWRYYVWLILAIRLIIPVDVSLKSVSINILELQNRILNNTVRIEERFSDNTSVYDFETSTNELNSNKTEGTVNQNWEDLGDNQNKEIGIESINNDRTLSKHQIAFILWILGVFVFFNIDILKYYSFKRKLKRWRISVGNTQYNSLLKDSLIKMNINKSINLYISKIINTPMVTGIIKPSIYIPHENYSKEEFEIIIKHELIHYKRHDLHYKLLLMVAKTIHWFNPFVYFMVNEANKDLEFLCDDEVIKNENFEYRERYTKIILDSARTGIERKTYLSTSFFGGVKTMKTRFANILSERQDRKGYRFLIAIALVLIMSNLFISCDKNINTTPQISKSNNTESKEPWELPEKDEELVQRMALRIYSADMPRIEYASDKIAIISDYWGIAVYDLEKERLCRVVDLISIDMSATQGDDCRAILVNKEGTQIIIKRAFKSIKRPKNPVPNYLYDIEKNKLEVTEKEEFENYADNIFSVNDEEVKNSLKDINLDTFHYNIARIGTNKWLGLKYAHSYYQFYDMRSLKIYVFEDGKEYSRQVFDKYNDLPRWPTDNDIIENHMGYIEGGKKYGQSIGFEGLTEEEVMAKFKKGSDWKFVEAEGEVEKYMKKIDGHDVLIGVWASINSNTKETLLNVRVY